MASSGRLDFGTTRAIRTRDWRFRGRASPIRPCLRQLAQYTNVDALNSRPSANAFAFCPLALHSRTRSDHFVSFSVMRAECRSLRRPGRTGLVQGVHTRSDDAIEQYLEGRYGDRPWHGRRVRWHSSESAALKAEERQIDAFERSTGSKPPWNIHAGGGGGTIYVICGARRANGRRCRNVAVGRRRYCHTHGRR